MRCQISTACCGLCANLPRRPDRHCRRSGSCRGALRKPAGIPWCRHAAYHHAGCTRHGGGCGSLRGRQGRDLRKCAPRHGGARRPAGTHGCRSRILVRGLATARGLAGVRPRRRPYTPTARSGRQASPRGPADRLQNASILLRIHPPPAQLPAPILPGKSADCKPIRMTSLPPAEGRWSGPGRQLQVRHLVRTAVPCHKNHRSGVC